ncbi:hypothetical protein IPZ58_05315 [Streptomyces roseoverticillatus]|uniref:hypothetical protein n=1 Tax=Streptomyces roseoverticillatus TaxID=66429 RepID=UPI001F463A62|nr:hypothetical protein [Streptomyces roseoverticillatus]MCF3100994.1 hypothetical protein [Streptomyces roseoverticillatus]
MRKHLLALLSAWSLGIGGGMLLDSTIRHAGEEKSSVATFNDGFDDGARDIREQLAPIIANNPDECWIRENIPNIPNSPKWCDD